MSAKLIVTVFGAVLITLVNWYFFFSKKKTRSVDVQDEGIK